MARRVQRVPEPPSSRVVVPADIAAGPEIGRWASPEKLDVVDRLRPAPAGKGSPQRLRDAEGDAMVSAWCRWRDARNAWFSEAGLTDRERMALVPSRRPFWGEAEGASHARARHPPPRRPLESDDEQVPDEPGLAAERRRASRTATS